MPRRRPLAGLLLVFSVTTAGFSDNTVAACSGGCWGHVDEAAVCGPSRLADCRDGTIGSACDGEAWGVETTAGGFDACLDQFLDQTPPVLSVGLGELRDLCFDSFAVLHSGESKTPLFVAEHLDKARLIDARDQERTDRFYEEARLPAAERARLQDYSGSGYDRGHMAPAADMPNPDAMAQSFSLANIVPQAHDNNGGVWAEDVEGAARDYVWRNDADLYLNIFGRAPDAAGKAYWLGELESGHIQRNQMIVTLLDGGWSNPDAAEDMKRFSNRIQVGLAFAEEQVYRGILYSALSTDQQATLREMGRDILSEVTADSETREAAKDRIWDVLDLL